MPKNFKISKDVLNLAKKKVFYKENPLVFIEDCVKLPIPGCDEAMTLYESQKTILRSFFEDHNLIMLKSRQIGMSTLCQAIITYIFTFYDNCVIGIISRDGKESSDFCRKVTNMLDNLPDWVRPGYKNKSIQYLIMDNGCQLHTSAVSPANPGSVFRSKSLTMLVLDEAAHILNVDEAWTGIASTLSKTQLDASRNGVPYGTVILSTPNKTEGIGRWFFQMWSGALRGDNIFKPHKIHWKEIPAYANDPEWYSNQCKAMNNDRNRIAQELELKFVGSDECLFDENVQMQLQESFTDKVEVVSLPVAKNRGELWKFRKINKHHFHIIGVDVSTIAGKDYSTVEVMEYQTMQQVMEFHGKVDPKEFADVVRIIAAHCPHNIICVDNQGGYGQSLLYDLYYDEEVEYNLYGTYSGSETDRNRRKFQPGLSINAKTRPLILDALHDYVSHDPGIVASTRLSSELLALVTKRGSRIEADTGFHDDLAFAFAYCCYLRKYCSDELGDIEPLAQDKANQIFTDDSLKVLMGINGEAPLIGTRKYHMLKQAGAIKDDNTDTFKDDVSKYIEDKLESGELGGVVDVFDLIGDSDIMSGVIDDIY